MLPGEHICATVRGLAFGGDAVAEAPDGRVVFFPGGAPGDEVELRVEEVKARFARGALVRVLAPGPARVEARCPLVGRCGGCQWQEVALEVQQASKRAVVERALRRLDVEVRPLVAPTGGFGYRARVRLTRGPGGELGFQARRSHQVVDVQSCPLLEPALSRALAAARPVALPLLAPGGTVAGLVGRGGAVHLAFTGVREARATAVEPLRGLIGIAGIVGVVVEGEREGAPGVDLSDEGEPPFLAAADGFAQAAHDGNRALRALVASEAGGPHARVLELFAGDGNFTRDLARAAGEVVAVEGERAACGRLRANMRSLAGGRGRVVVRAEPAEQVARLLARAGESFDVVVLDPPRAGAVALVETLPALAPSVVYVSCDPMTLARDAAVLASRGLRPLRATPVDLMPQTYHVETVCSFHAG